MRGAMPWLLLRFRKLRTGASGDLTGAEGHSIVAPLNPEVGMTARHGLALISCVVVAAAIFLAAAGVLSPRSAAARPIVPAERRYDSYAGVLPTCADPGVFARIQSLFHDRETEFWKSGLEIVNLTNIHEIGFRSEGLDYIPRRYCEGRVFLNNQNTRAVSYTIVEDAGFAGFGYEVEWCVAGLDRNEAYGGYCRDARP